jgi:plasmid rolling circle replication initiator protein Rep
MWKARFIKALPAITAAHPTARWIFLTLTVKNCELAELRDTLTVMNRAWARLSQRKVFPAIGWVKSFEVTRNPDDGTAHPHFHVLMMVPPAYFSGQGYINQEQWRELWQHALRADYEVWGVNVKAIRPKSTQGGLLDPNTALLAAVKETFKYSVKGQDLIADASWLVGLTHQLHKMRAIALGGVLKDYLSEEEPDHGDLIHGDEDEGEISPDDPRWWFGWKEMVKRYLGSESKT